MKTSEIIYTGELRTKATHLRSGEVIITDAPIDNQGKGASFSPTDLAATSLGSCMLTVMGIAARGRGIDLGIIRTELLKVMAEAPRRISEIHVHVIFENNFDENTRRVLEQTALNCPVAKSLHPDILQKVTFDYGIVSHS
ncbi:MAG: OsmC family protein [Bacteroidia bacterium]|nr:OsmC family protein [Bacteroidia bacterium]